MTAASDDILPKTRERNPQPFAIATGVDVYGGSLGSLGGPRHGTAAKQGALIPFAAAAGEIPLGFMGGESDQGNLALTTGPLPAAIVDTAGRVQLLTVAGIANATADKGQIVYATDDSAFTLTRPSARQLPMGIIVGLYSATKVYVAVLSTWELLVLQLCGRGKSLMYLGSYDCDTIANGDLRTGIPMPFAGTFLDIFAMVDVAITGSSGTALLNMEIDGTNVTGGVVTVSTAAGGTKGTKLAGTAITAAARFNESSALDIEAATVTDMTAGRIDLYATVVAEPGL